MTCIWYGLVGNDMVYDMIWQARHGTWYGLACMALYMVWPDGHGIVYVRAWRAWHGMWYGLTGITGHGIWHGLACIALYMV